MRRVSVVPFLLSGLLVAGCAAWLDRGTATPTPVDASDPTPEAIRTTLRYVALGDTYTIGTGVRERERWPNQLVRALQPELALDITANLAAPSTSSREVIARQLPLLDQLDPQFVSVQVGHLDVVRLADPETFRANIATILEAVLRRRPASRIVVITIPDYALTPRGDSFHPRDEQSALIDQFNAILVEETSERGLTIVDIAPVADRVVVDPSLVGPDELSPSAKQYAGWVELIAPRVQAMLLGES